MEAVNVTSARSHTKRRNVIGWLKPRDSWWKGTELILMTTLFRKEHVSKIMMMMKMLNSLGIMERIIWIVLSPAATATSKITKTETRNKEFGVQRKREYSTFYLYFLSGSYTFVYDKSHSQHDSPLLCVFRCTITPPTICQYLLL